MTDLELKKLKRVELLEMLLTLSREHDRLRERLGEMQSAREEQSAQMRKLSELAETALQVTGIIAAAQEAAELYTAQARERAEALVEKTRLQCQKLLDEARDQAGREGPRHE